MNPIRCVRCSWPMVGDEDRLRDRWDKDGIYTVTCGLCWTEYSVELLLKRDGQVWEALRMYRVAHTGGRVYRFDPMTMLATEERA